ncbi:MAG: primosomal protein N' [Treponema sp.]|jgi:primosomal protein N' (replication factor Y)|nr:primosomal protein N' [Treponema sp.]
MPGYVDVVFDIPANSSFTYRIDDKGSACVGKRVMAPFGRRNALGFVVGERDALPPGLEEKAVKSISRVVDKETAFGTRDIELAEWISGYYLCSLGEALAAMLPSGKKTGDYPSFSSDEMTTAALSLSEEQEAALAAITARETAFQTPSSRFPLFYLYGVTGSGKTEVFLRAAEAMLQEGKSVIYLVPEISLTMQTSEAVGKRFHGIATTFHSGMSPAARFTEWMKIRRGDIRIVVGPRSAIFAPVQNLGLVIIDEEHDGSYKSGSTPRYHARQVAMRRCKMEHARLVMGSATPSAEAWRLMPTATTQAKPLAAERGGGITRLDLTKRLSGGKTPDIRIVALDHADGCLTGALKEEIRKTVTMNRQTILFLNRRGFAYFYHCPDCGFELACKHCSVSLTFHKARNRAVCHYCGYSETPPAACPQCGSLSAGYAGFGTESIEEEVRRAFPDIRVRRADADTMNSGKHLKETLEDFRNGKFDILLGTQMVAKGLNFPGVRLVGVVLADTGLHIPDFRSAERTFSLIVQVAGRSGRYFPDGVVIVQTLRPADPIITRACALDVEGFFTAEIAQRKALNFPPWTRLIRFTVRSKDGLRANKAIKRLASILQPLLPHDADMLGPAECPIGLIAENYRRHILVRGKTMSALHAAARGALPLYDKGKDGSVYLEIDVDPVNVL